MALLLTATLVYLPVVLPRFASGVPVSPWAIAEPVLVLMLAPLVAGMALRAGAPRLAGGVLQPLQWISRGALIALLILVGELILFATAAAMGRWPATAGGE
jgi:BASS family bile acid:Na+ symporter